MDGVAGRLGDDLDRDVLSGVAVFVAVTEVGSFTAAADQLGLTKASVGRTIARLEQRLGFKLFDRNRRITNLTEHGAAYFAACTAAISSVAAAQVALASDQARLGGRVHIDVPAALGRRLIVPAVFDIARRQPDLSLTVGFSDGALSRSHDETDLMICLGRPQEQDGYISRHLGTFKRGLYASPAYLKAHGEPMTLGDLGTHRCILGLPRGPLGSWLFADGVTERRFTPPSLHRFGNADAIVDAAVAGLGIAQLLQPQARACVLTRSLKQVMVAVPTLDVEMHMVWPLERQFSPAVRHLVEGLTAFVEEERLGQAMQGKADGTDDRAQA